MIIGITGQIGSGKSTAARLLKQMGAVVIDADQIGREVVEQNPALLKGLVKRFGDEILTPKGKLDRKKLAALAFRNNDTRDMLNRLVHPYLLKELNRQMKSLAKRHRLVVIDAALLLYWNLDQVVDKVILIHASQKIRLRRLAERGIGRKDALARQRQQLSYTEQRKRADHVIFNNGTPQELKLKLQKVIAKSVD
ncbi:MAG: dephospho-CoA kinase [Candidatus Zixiibacteriota bacterium]